MSTTTDRAFKAINLAQFNENNLADFHPLGYPLTPPKEQRILRMLVKEPFKDAILPEELGWIMSLLLLAMRQQANMGIHQPYCYITSRCGTVQDTNNDTWHTDGFSMNITHLPEQNYIWCSSYGTEICKTKIAIPEDFNPMVHNLHDYLNHCIQDLGVGATYHIDPWEVACLDAYIIHRRPQIPEGTYRAFVRIDFSPIMIIDDLNTPNPHLHVKRFNREGVKDFRDKLIKYPY